MLWDLLLKYAISPKKILVYYKVQRMSISPLQELMIPRPANLRTFRVMAMIVALWMLLRCASCQLLHLPTSVMSMTVNLLKTLNKFKIFLLYHLRSFKKKYHRKTKLHGRIGASENVLYNSLANESLRKESSSNAKQNSQCIDKSRKKIAHSNCNMLSHQLVTRREPALRNPLPSTSGKHLLPRSVHVDSHQREKHRISIWDRLGKPCDGVPSGVKTVKLCDGSGTVYQKQELLNQHKAMLPVLNSELRGSMTGGVTSLGNIQPESRKLERRKRTMHEAQEGASQNSIRSNMIKEILKLLQRSCFNVFCFAEVLDVKQKLHKFELDMSKLRSKQVVMEKDGKYNILSHSDAKRDAEENTEMRTVSVTNVHFAATKEAISLYFTKCGVVENVLILADKTTGQRKGSAYVSFASKDSVEKAVALSGATFVFRTLKVSRKADQLVGSSTSEPSPPANEE
ncbi:hypothetical protein SADUNF_Sadunf12G0113900 [Salix dunnii]|uniref:RRM domain-containing protein n=1 Tax=Salix dunnii TaxID=1413687 RepID=A0A835JP31_9ROSI|nr:hypothetical protein SADUNF_Sadunf12G0113900 [Salix dunnii]